MNCNKKNCRNNNGGVCVAIEAPCINKKTKVCVFYKSIEADLQQQKKISDRLVSFAGTASGSKKLVNLLTKYPSLQRQIQNNGHSEFIKTFKGTYGISL